MRYLPVKYTRYPFFTDELISILLKANNIKKKNKLTKQDKFNLIGKYLDGNMQQITENPGAFLIHEDVWRQSEKTLVYPLDERVVDSIRQGKCDLKHIESIDLFSEEFIFNFPKSYKLAGQPTCSVLVSFKQGEDLDFHYAPNMLKRFGVTKGINIQNTEKNTLMSVLFRRYNLVSKDLEDYSASIPWKTDYVRDYLALDEDQYRAKNELEKIGTEEFNEADNIYVKAVIRLMINLVVYVHATNRSTLESGFPNQFRSDKNTVFNIGPVNPICMGSKHQPDSKLPHYRTWFLRQLVNEKFYKTDEWKDKPRGSRWVFVSETNVGEKVTPKTVM
jgi:hypothetical protein